MTGPEFTALIKRIHSAFPGSQTPEKATIDIWYEIVKDIDPGQARRAADLIIRETEFIRPQQNLGAMLRNRATPTVTSATIEGHLHQALHLLRIPDGNPYQYLRGISPRLLEMAEKVDLFDRGLSTQDAGFRVRDLAKKFLERAENEKRGFVRSDGLPPERQLEAPKEQNNDELRQKNAERCRQFLADIAAKKALEKKGDAAW
jgi:hypothetical protein